MYSGCFLTLCSVHLHFLLATSCAMDLRWTVPQFSVVDSLWPSDMQAVLQAEVKKDYRSLLDSVELTCLCHLDIAVEDAYFGAGG